MSKIDRKLGLVAAVLFAAVASSQSGLIGFGVKNSDINERLAGAFINSHLPVYPNARAYHAASAAAQVAFVKSFLAAIKAYTQTPAFRAEYEKRRESARPQPPVDKGSASDQASAQQTQLRKQIEEMKKQVASMPANVQPQMQEMIKKLEDKLNKQDNDPQYQSMLKQGAEMEMQNAQKRYQQDLAYWQTKYPEQPNALIAQRLKDFLALSADIDFSAKLTKNSHGVLHFDDAQYEHKSQEWKIGYRAGREPVAAARSFAAEWLRQLEK
jgi:TolA-binding protein